MTEPRKSTVYDFSDLRLHPNGTRVYQKSTNLRPTLARSTVQDARSNWIATDAGGSAKVPLFRKKKRVTLQEKVEESKDEDISEGGEDSSVEVADKKGKRKSKRQDRRTAKRRKFLQTDDFLAGVSTDVGGSSDVNPSSLPHPSPDLLKCIHRFASKFYSERGQLLNSSRQYRIERKERRMKRALDCDSSPSSHSTSSSDSESRSKTADKVDESEDESDDDASEGDDADDTVGTKRRKRRKGRRRSDKLYVDMYKVFDGSAMLALGMLVQEHIAFLLKPSIPESWERETRSAYTDPWGDSPELKDDGIDGKVRQGSPDVGKELQGVSESVAGSTSRQRKSPERSPVLNMMDETPDRTSQPEFDHDDLGSEEEDESSRSDDTRHTSDSEDEYR